MERLQWNRKSYRGGDLRKVMPQLSNPKYASGLLAGALPLFKRLEKSSKKRKAKITNKRVCLITLHREYCMMMKELNLKNLSSLFSLTFISLRPNKIKES